MTTQPIPPFAEPTYRHITPNATAATPPYTSKIDRDTTHRASQVAQQALNATPVVDPSPQSLVAAAVNVIRRCSPEQEKASPAALNTLPPAPATPHSPDQLKQTLASLSATKPNSLVVDFAKFLNTFYSPSKVASQDRLIPLDTSHRASSWVYWITLLCNLGKRELATQFYSMLVHKEWSEANLNTILDPLIRQLTGLQNELQTLDNELKNLQNELKKINQKLNKHQNKSSSLKTRKKRYLTISAEYKEKLDEHTKKQKEYAEKKKEHECKSMAYKHEESKCEKIKGYRAEVLALLPIDIVEKYQVTKIDLAKIFIDLANIASQHTSGEFLDHNY